MKWGLGAVVSGLMFVFVCVGTASANTYCVPTGGGAGCFNSGALDLQPALTLAQANPGPDTVKVAAISLLPVDCTTAGFSYSGATNNPLTLTGAGTTQTFLTCQNNYNNQPNTSHRSFRSTALRPCRTCRSTCPRGSMTVG
jgi:hypothetical protein